MTTVHDATGTKQLKHINIQENILCECQQEDFIDQIKHISGKSTVLTSSPRKSAIVPTFGTSGTCSCAPPNTSFSVKSHSHSRHLHIHLPIPPYCHHIHPSLQIVRCNKYLPHLPSHCLTLYQILSTLVFLLDRLVMVHKS